MVRSGRPALSTNDRSLFIKGLARGDKFSAVPILSRGASLNLQLSKHQGIEIFPQLKHYAIDVPASVDCHAVNTMMDRLPELGFAIAFPVWRK